MANEKPTDDTRVVPLDLSIERRQLLRNEIEIWRDGVWEDLENPSKLADPERTRRLAATYERLIEAIKRGTIELPDDEARAALQRAADGFDDAEEWEQTKTIHDAQRALLAVFDRGQALGPNSDRDLPIESAVLRRVLDVHPARLSRSELLRELAGEEANSDTRDRVDRAIRELGGVGLVHTLDEFVKPTKAAVRFRELLQGEEWAAG